MIRIRRIILWSALMWFVALLWIIPFYSSITVSLKPMKEITSGNTVGLPQTLYLDNFLKAWKIGVSKYLLNSFIIVPSSVIGALLLSSLAGYALSQYPFKGNGIILTIFLLFNLLPPQMNLIPVYKLSKALNIYDTYLGLILYHASFQTGFCTFFLRNFMRTIPSSMIDAGRIDGCSEFGIFWRIVLPLSVTPIVALAILEFTWIWNDFLWGTVLLKTDSLKPVTVGIQHLQGAYIAAWGLQNAGALIAVLPTVLVFIFLRKYFIRGLTGGYKF